MLIEPFLKPYTGSNALPFHLTYAGEGFDSASKPESMTCDIKEDESAYYETITCLTADGRLEVKTRATLFKAFHAAEIGLELANIGDTDTQIISNIYSFYADLLTGENAPVLYRANGAPSNTNDFIPYTFNFNDSNWSGQGISGSGGRSSNNDLPYFRVDCDRYAAVFGIGWSGQVKAHMTYHEQKLHVRCGMEGTHFKLYPGEKVTMPFVTVLFEQDKQIAFSEFRRLVYDCYIPSKDDAYLFCNTCFTRGGGWLNECNEENQISLIKALAPLGVKNVITDAGWFIGGWPAGAGSWDPDPEKYPNGIQSVAKAAEDLGMKYGLWFELERAVEGSTAQKEHPDWCLYDNLSFLPSEFVAHQRNSIINLGIPEAVDYIYNIVDIYLKMPGFECYRQDFNVDPLNFWRSNDTPDRIGITEIKYLNGLYNFLDRIRANYPNIFMDGCSGGGRRLDLAMIRRFNTSQKTDYWFHAAVDQTSLFSLNCYLPSISFTSHVDKAEEYLVLTNLAATLCIGFIADAPDFDVEKAKGLLTKFFAVRPLLNDRYYPLTPIDETHRQVLAMEFYDRTLKKGALIIYNRGGEHYRHTLMHPNCYYEPIHDMNGATSGKITLYPKEIRQSEQYKLTDIVSNRTFIMSGKQLLDGLDIIINKEPCVLVYIFEKENGEVS